MKGHRGGLAEGLLCVLSALAIVACSGEDEPPDETCEARHDLRCGPCGRDTYVCIDGEWVCDGATECGLGARCSADDECTEGECYAGRCVPPGMAFVPAGAFFMGSRPTELGRVEGEDLHPVEITRHYFIDRHEVTQGDFERLTGFNPSFFIGCGPDCPVENVRWVEALAYANLRSEAEGLPPCYDLSRCRGTHGVGSGYVCEAPIDVDLDCTGYRLPTEAEWERAYRAGTHTAFYNGNPTEYANCDQPLLYEIAQFCGNCSVSYGQVVDCSMGGLRPDQPTDCGTTRVGSYAPNAWGIYDMAGNVSELVWDTRGDYPEYAVDPTGAAEQDGWVMVRGAGFCGHMARLRAADRKATTWHTPSPATGFRLVRTFRRARPEERVGTEVCDNGCGSCAPLEHAPGTPCGPCGADVYVCTSESSTECSGATTGCEYGRACERTEDCAVGVCSNGHCVAPGFAYVPAGTFTMGGVPGELGTASDETLHEVTITRPFMMQETEVTQRLFQSLMGVNPSRFYACGPNCPVDTVNRFDAMAFANALSRLHGLQECYDLSACEGTIGVNYTCPPGVSFDLDCEGYRLPTEAEWERAYRAGTATLYHNGSPEAASQCEQPLLDDIAQYCGNCAVTYEGAHECGLSGEPMTCGTSPVGQYAPNAWGLYDMSGNVAEAVWDVYGPYESNATDPTGPADTGQQLVLRGGGFCGDAVSLRAAERRTTSRVARPADAGFRIVRTLPGG